MKFWKDLASCFFRLNAIWSTWRRVEAREKGKERILFLCCFSFTRVSLQINTIRLYSTKYEWIYIQKLVKLKIFIIPWRPSLLIFSQIFLYISSSKPSGIMFIIFYHFLCMQKAKHVCSWKNNPWIQKENF